KTTVFGKHKDIANVLISNQNVTVGEGNTSRLTGFTKFDSSQELITRSEDGETRTSWIWLAGVRSNPDVTSRVPADVAWPIERLIPFSVLLVNRVVYENGIRRPVRDEQVVTVQRHFAGKRQGRRS